MFAAQNIRALMTPAGDGRDIDLIPGFVFPLGHKNIIFVAFHRLDYGKTGFALHVVVGNPNSSE
ncbi:MAG: hypothetical protein Pars92KO_15070 [Parasphingorhabdus sp.]